MSTRRHYKTIVGHLRDDPETATELVGRLDDEVLVHLGAAVADEVRRRAVAGGDPDAAIADGFDTGFGRDGLAVLPWVSEPFIVCPGGLVGRNRASHRCRFISVNDTWVWDSVELIDEVKRSSPGTDDGFRAVALIPIVEGTSLDVVSGRMRSGQHRVDQVVSYQVRKGELIEVSQRTVAAAGML
ncbi:MAG: hypothetical protein OES57_09150 [Acidimicrobiia bacterium]|nr:hypothetical protein [Acidimicrobiia bacterium]